MALPAPSVERETESAELGADDSEERRDLLPLVTDRRHVLQVEEGGQGLPHLHSQAIHTVK